MNNIAFDTLKDLINTGNFTSSNSVWSSSIFHFYRNSYVAIGNNGKCFGELNNLMLAARDYNRDGMAG